MCHLTLEGSLYIYPAERQVGKTEDSVFGSDIPLPPRGTQPALPFQRNPKELILFFHSNFFLRGHLKGSASEGACHQAGSQTWSPGAYGRRTLLPQAASWFPHMCNGNSVHSQINYKLKVHLKKAIRERCTHQNCTSVLCLWLTTGSHPGDRV